MSNSLAIATVTASLKNVLQSAFNTNVPDQLNGSEVSTLSPADPNVSKKGANVYLYQVSPNAALRNATLPSRNSSGALSQPPQVALDLHYLISFYGSDLHWEPQRFLGIAARTLNALPVLGQRIVSQTIQSVGQTVNFEFIAGSDLSDGPQFVRLTPAEISLEELSKLWSILLQTKYALSVLYVASLVLIDGLDPAAPAPPVLERHLSINPMRPIAIRQVIGAAEGSILSGSSVAVLGTGLLTPGLVISLDGVSLSSAFTLQRDDRIEFVLPATIRTGAHGLRIAAFAAASSLPIVESNLSIFLVQPSISAAITKTGVVANPSGAGLFDGNLTVPVNPRVLLTQRISLLLNRKDAPVDQPAPGVVLALHPAPPATTTDTNALVFPFTAVPGGVYAARLRVDDVESPVTLLGSGTIGPEVTIP